MQQTYFKQRRDKFLTQIGDGIAVLFAAPQVARNADNHFPYRTDSYFYYLTGISEPNAIAIFAPNTDKPFRLFVEPKNDLKELWEGKMLGVEGAASLCQPDACQPIKEFEDSFLELLRKAGKVYYQLGLYEEYDQKLLQFVSSYRPRPRDGDRFVEGLVSVLPALGELRKIKDEAEIEVMRKACENTAQGHIQAMRMTKPGRYEFEVAADMEAAFRKGGAQDLAYPSIVGGGANATVLHYTTNREQLKDGDLLLIDAGGELDLYASDITRTFPVNGKFSSAQKKIYEIVLAAQEAAIAEAQPGKTYHGMHDKAVEVLIDGMIDLKLLEGSRAEILEQGVYRKYYPHNTGHWLGLDVHDAGTYFKEDFSSVTLVEGNVFTVEPGLYFPVTDQNVPEEFRGIGIRIEDDVLITKTGHEILTKSAPKTVNAIEDLVGTGLS